MLRALFVPGLVEAVELVSHEEEVRFLLTSNNQMSLMCQEIP